MPPEIPQPWGAFLSDLDARLDRNAERDREDVYHLARKVPLDLDALRKRYEAEMRPYLGDAIQKRTDGTLSWWVEAIEEERRG